MDPEQDQKKLKAAKRFGEGLLLILVAVNLVEFWLALVVKYQPLLAVTMMFLALVDVVFILWYFMHLPRLLGGDKEDHECLPKLHHWRSIAANW